VTGKSGKGVHRLLFPTKTGELRMGVQNRMEVESDLSQNHLQNCERMEKNAGERPKQRKAGNLS